VIRFFFPGCRCVWKPNAKRRHASSDPNSPPISRHGVLTAEPSLCSDQRLAPPAASTLSLGLWPSSSGRKRRLPRPGPSECHATCQTCSASARCPPTTPPLRAVLRCVHNKNLLYQKRPWFLWSVDEAGVRVLFFQFSIALPISDMCCSISHPPGCGSGVPPTQLVPHLSELLMPTHVDFQMPANVFLAHLYPFEYGFVVTSFPERQPLVGFDAITF